MSLDTQIPLAERRRPKTLKEYVGQKHLIGEGGPIKRTLTAGLLPSIILWGPPGVGKTTLANLLASELKRPMFALSAVESGVKDVREVIQKAGRSDLFSGGKPIVFIDEIHRFSKSQQDSLLGAVERGTITLVGATTENPSFEVISALLSRCQTYTLEALSKDELLEIVNDAIKNDDWLKTRKIKLVETDALLRSSGGDARKLLNAIEIVASSGKAPVKITDELVLSILKQNMARYDKTGEQHYDIVSAFIKSIRGSDPNAAVYYLARMIEGGEDPKFIARRLLISASEDIGNANPAALPMAESCFRAVEVIGWPESRIILSQTTIYLACSEKSNAAYEAIGIAQKLVRETGDLSVPLPLRNAPTKLMKELGYGKEYQYAHSFPGNFVDQEYLPEEVAGQRLFEPGNNSRENAQRERLKRLWKQKYGY